MKHSFTKHALSSFAAFGGIPYIPRKAKTSELIAHSGFAKDRQNMAGDFRKSVSRLATEPHATKR